MSEHSAVTVHREVNLCVNNLGDPRLNASPNRLSEDENFSRRRILKNTVIVSLAVMLYLTSSLPCRELQGSINIKSGLGVWSQFVFSASSIISQLFLPPIIIYYLGLKHCITLALLLESVFYFSNFYPTFYVMLPAALISGFAGAPIWTAKATYLTLLAEKWSKAFKIPVEITISFQFGLFYAFYYFGYVWGNVASYYILVPTNVEQFPPNSTRHCGISFCDLEAEQNNSNFRRPPELEIYILFGAFILISWLGALLVALFLDPIKPEKVNEKTHCGLILMTPKALKDPHQCLLIPISFFRGIMRAFVTTEFTKAFVTCSLGVQYVGLTMVSFGVLSGLSSICFSHLVRWTGRVPLFCLSTIIQVALAIFLSEWIPNIDNQVILFVIPALFGVSNSVWESQVANIYGIIFPGRRDVSFSLYSCAEGFGTVVAQSYSYYLCLEVKLIILVAFLVLGFISYLITELLIIRKHVLSLEQE